jgi:hypothetical protein
MRLASASILVGAVTLFGVAIPAAVHSQSANPVRYEVAHGSELLFGCFGPCDCAVVGTGVDGEFVLLLTAVDPLFYTYEMRNVALKFTARDSVGDVTVQATGHGTYERGGEFAVMERMTLDLRVDDPRFPPFFQHYDSGLVPPHADFPDIDIEVRLRVDACRDSVIRVVARPVAVASVAPGPVGRLLQSAMPNPTPGGVEVLLAPRTSGRARVDVVDVRGRIVATLVDGAVAGPLRLRWNGRGPRGTDVGAGIFWISARVGDEADRLRIVRLR